MDRSALLKEFGFKEEIKEIIRGKYGPSGFPAPLKAYRLSLEKHDLSLEEPYFWVLDTLKDNMVIVEKLEDSFAAAENSAFFGVSQQRLGAQQDRVSQFLATAGKMIKELFQMVRELRILDERLGYYQGVAHELNRPLAERKRGDEITLKGMFVDLVQGGGKSAASVYGMARELEFITLPDLFFDAPPFRTKDELEAYVSSLARDFNENVLRVLRRHLNQYFEWKRRTHQEHENRRGFMLKYLLQHYEVIRMYITWVKPYLRNVSKLTMKQQHMSSPDLVAAFEGSMLDIEILGRNRVPVDQKGKYAANGCVLVTFNYRTRSELKVVSEGYQRGPVQVGKFEMNIRVYGWSDEDVQRYKDMKEKELLMLMEGISDTVYNAMQSLGKELQNYVKEAQQSLEEGSEEQSEQPQAKPKKSLFEKLFGDFYTPQGKAVPSEGYTPKQIAGFIGKANSLSGPSSKLVFDAKGVAWNTFKNFKKSHRMVQW